MQELLVTALLSLISACAFAQGGPPLVIDDPGTPGDSKWEINGVITTDISRSRQTYGLPALDFNYGLGSAARANLGTSKVGVKWRFVDENKSGVAVSIYPQLTLNSPMQLLIPIEVFKNFNGFEVMGEAGINFISGQLAQLLYAFAGTKPRFTMYLGMQYTP